MKTKKLLFSLAIIFFGALVLTSPAVARMACDSGCLAPAKTAFQGCMEDCKEAFQDAKDSCRNIDPECADTCRESYETCIFDPLAALAECKLTKCNPPLATAVTNCRALYSKGENRDKCIDQAQVVAFQCRDECREAANPALKICRDTFKACMIDCKLPPPVAP